MIMLCEIWFGWRNEGGGFRAAKLVHHFRDHQFAGMWKSDDVDEDDDDGDTDADVRARTYVFMYELCANVCECVCMRCMLMQRPK